MTAASFASIINPSAILAVIRKDARLLWPFALALALLHFGLTARYLEKEGYPVIMLDFGDSQLHVEKAIELFHTVGMPIVIAIFIAMLIHKDPAHDARHDWMSRPISPLDIVAAKILATIIVVLLPLIAGAIVYTLTNDRVDQDRLALDIFLTVICSTFMIVVAWLASSPVQALLAPFGLAILAMATALTLGGPLGLVMEMERPEAVESPSPARLKDVASSARIPLPPEAPPVPAPAPAPDTPTVELPSAASPTASPQLRIVALKRERLEIHAPDGVKLLDRTFEPGESYIPARIDAGWTVSTRDGSAFEWQLGDIPLGLFAESGPVNAKSIDAVMQRQPSAGRGAARAGAARAPLDLRVIEGRRNTNGAIIVGRIELIAQLLIAFVAAGVVLWLLLARRRLLTARLAFLGFFVATVLLLTLQSSIVSPRDELITFRSVAAVRPSAPEPQRMAAFAANDKNKDQRLDKTEYAAVLEELGFSNQFDDLWMQRDDDMDGFISVQEYRAAIPSVPGGRPPAPDLMRFAAFAKHDIDKDNKLSETEYRAVISELGFGDDFATLWPQRDGNKDGFISAEEYGMPPQ